MPIEDAKPIVIFTTDQERIFLEACDDWQFPLFFTLLLTGLRPGSSFICCYPTDLNLKPAGFASATSLNSAGR